MRPQRAVSPQYDRVWSRNVWQHAEKASDSGHARPVAMICSIRPLSAGVALRRLGVTLVRGYRATALPENRAVAAVAGASRRTSHRARPPKLAVDWADESHASARGSAFK